jgi:hypothetical protein
MVCHRCDNPPCCRPDHLFLGTAKDNSQDSMQKGRARVGLPGPSPWRDKYLRGEDNPHAKLTASQVLEIRRRRNESCLVLAKEFRVSAGLISGIWNRRCWAHLP